MKDGKVIIADAVVAKINEMREKKRKKWRRERLLALIDEVLRPDGLRSMPDPRETLTSFLLLNGQPSVTVGRADENVCPQTSEELLENVVLVSERIPLETWEKLRNSGAYIIGLPGMTVSQNGGIGRYSASWMLHNLLSGLLRGNGAHYPLKDARRRTADPETAALGEILDAFFRNEGIFPNGKVDGESSVLKYLVETAVTDPSHKAEAAFALAWWSEEKRWDGASVTAWLLSVATGEPSLPEAPPEFVLEALRRNGNLASNAMRRFLTAASESLTTNSGVGFDDIAVSGEAAFARRVGQSFAISASESLSKEGFKEEAALFTRMVEQLFGRFPDANLGEIDIGYLWIETTIVVAELYAEQNAQVRRVMARQAMELLEEAAGGGRFERSEFKHKWAAVKEISGRVIENETGAQVWVEANRGF